MNKFQYPDFKYVINQFKLFYHINKWPTISYGFDGQSQVQIKRSNTNFFLKTQGIPADEPVWIFWKDQQIPFFFDQQQNEIVTFENGQAFIHFDIIASAFYLLSGWQEYYSEAKDNLGRFPFSASIQHKYGFGNIPVVNYYFDILKYAIEKVSSKKLLGWHLEKPRIFLSHDIDKCATGWLEGGFNALKKGKFLQIPKLVTLKLLGKDVWFNLEKLASRFDQLGIKSTFYFLPKKGKGFKSLINADYNFQKKIYQRIASRLKEKGFEIGIHGSAGSSHNMDHFNNDLKKFPEPVNGNRFHYLLYTHPETGEILEQAGLEYDTSLGFAEYAGFRYGICYPFYPYNFKDRRPFYFMEIPLVVMDASLFQKKYMGLNSSGAWQHIIHLYGEIQKFNGVLSILWHNHWFSPYKYDKQSKFIWRLLHYFIYHNIKFDTGAEISKMVKNKKDKITG